ncbi:hypothetical protein FY528_15845 [Hymenobacter lutimineralis]|uniref:DUF2946 domain-containing protein n=2 Tax=Hymenobacter TaxID=89966 RepID=A0A5D6UUP4_9BACT|nr:MULTISPECIES: DUF6660 family protein [Hymenobacter]RYU84783.1 hypothetical protein EWM57_00205 [Hymenobacter persicinus]TYZ07286.1 hypothetical protein FY528_15845 [Hymenobacter lutimineralis]
MRFFSVFFAFYLALLACLPCADTAPVRVSGTETYVAATEHESEAHSRLDWCSPLCQCQCCSGTSLPTATVVALTAKPPFFIPPGRFARLAPPAPRERAGSIWQPPQA